MADQNHRILIVDDEIQLLELLQMEFEEGDFEVQIASTVDEAILKLESWTPDVILSDLKMPHRNGVELLDFIKNQYPKIPFIFMSGHAEEDDEGVVDAQFFFQKPFSLATVVDQVRSLVVK